MLSLEQGSFADKKDHVGNRLSEMRKSGDGREMTVLTRETVREIVQAFQKSGLEMCELTIPEGVEEIADAACIGMEQLQIVHMPRSLRRIGMLAFYGCRNLKEVHFPAGLKEIGTAAFKECGITKIIIPSKVNSIGSEAFADNPLKYAEVKGGGTGVAMFRGCRQLTRVVLGDKIRIIAEGMLRDCESLKSICIPESVKTLKKDAFRGCRELSRVQLPKSATEIGAGAFYGCGIRSIRIPEKIQVVQAETFCMCEKLGVVWLPKNVVCVESGAFYGCTALKKVCLEVELGRLTGFEVGEGNRPLMAAVLRCGVRPEEFE